VVDFPSLLQNSEPSLLAAVMKHAERQRHTPSGLEEIWNMAFRGLTTTLVQAVAAGKLVEPWVDLEDRADPVVAFGRLEAKRHRVRGIGLEMFLRLMKIFRPSYLEVLRERIADPDEQAESVQQMVRFFDRIELSFCLAWDREAESGDIKDLQDMNLELLNERDRYVAIFESTPLPTILLNPDLSIRNMNHAAYRLILQPDSPGAYYYNAAKRPGTTFLADLFPDFFKAIRELLEQPDARLDQEWSTTRKGVQMHFHVVVARMLDQPYAASGILVTLDDQTDRVQASQERERMLVEITAALAEVRNLSNLLPICAWCKKIRDDQGYWDQLEGYFATHTGIRFSHGVCPECASNPGSALASQKSAFEALRTS